MFYANEHEPVHVHGKSQGREARAEFIIINGVINEKQVEHHCNLMKCVTSKKLSAISQTKLL